MTTHNLGGAPNNRLQPTVLPPLRSGKCNTCLSTATASVVLVHWRYVKTVLVHWRQEKAGRSAAPTSPRF